MKVRKMFLKPLAILMAVFMLIQLNSVVVVAEDEIFNEIVIEGFDCFQKMQLITGILNGETSNFQGIAPTSVLCIFGHSMAKGQSITTEHRVWISAPRCRRTTHRVDYCTRNGCSYMVLTQLSQVRIPCCS